VTTGSPDPEAGEPAPFERVSWPIRTERLSLRPATGRDAEATWSFRRLGAVARWLSRAAVSFEEHREQFAQRSR